MIAFRYLGIRLREKKLNSLIKVLDESVFEAPFSKLTGINTKWLWLAVIQLFLCLQLIKSYWRIN